MPAPYYNSYQQSYSPNPYNYNQQSFPQQSYNAPTPLMQANNGITWVQGEAGAKAYPVGAGSSVLLMDSEDKCFYIKSSDMSGIPQPLRVFTYEEVVHTQQPNNSYAALPDFHPEDYAKKQEVEELRDQMNRLVRQQENTQNMGNQNMNQNNQQLPQIQGHNSNNGGQNYAQ